MTRFVLASKLLPEARGIADEQAERLRSLVPDGELILTGGSSVHDALTRGDIDLHLRVPEPRFAAAVEALRTICDVARPEIWAGTLATFTDRDDPRVGIAVTPIGSAHDRRFVRSWERLREDAGALEAYNAMKRAHAGGDRAAYEREKAAFFDRLVARDP